ARARTGLRLATAHVRRAASAARCGSGAPAAVDHGAASVARGTAALSWADRGFARPRPTDVRAPAAATDLRPRTNSARDCPSAAVQHRSAVLPRGSTCCGYAAVRTGIGHVVLDPVVLGVARDESSEQRRTDDDTHGLRSGR